MNFKKTNVRSFKIRRIIRGGSEIVHSFDVFLNLTLLLIPLYVYVLSLVLDLKSSLNF